MSRNPDQFGRAKLGIQKFPAEVAYRRAIRCQIRPPAFDPGASPATGG
jgi:hypothetical protein